MFIKIQTSGQGVSAECRRHAVLMSRHLGLAQSRFCAAKADALDIVLAEMGSKPGSGAPLRMSLGQSIHQLRGFVRETEALVALMREGGYADLPNKRTFDFDQVSETVVVEGLSDKGAFDFATGTVEHTSFYQAFAYLEREAEYVISLTESLQATVGGLSESVIRAGCLTRVIEENGAGNLAAPFAELETAWGVLSSRVNAFVVLSTELSYDHDRTGSLVEGAMAKAAAA